MYLRLQTVASSWASTCEKFPRLVQLSQKTRKQKLKIIFFYKRTLFVHNDPGSMIHFVYISINLKVPCDFEDSGLLKRSSFRIGSKYIIPWRPDIAPPKKHSGFCRKESIWPNDNISTNHMGIPRYFGQISKKSHLAPYIISNISAQII